MLTVIIKTNNSEETISETLESVKDLGEIIVIDIHSDDDTVLIAKEYKAKIVYSSLIEFQDVFRQTLNDAQNDWILFLNGNEIIPEKLANNISNYVENPKKNKNAVFIPKKLFYLNKEIKCSRKFCLKLFKKTNYAFLNNFSIELKPYKTKTTKINKDFKNIKNCILQFEKDDVFTIVRKDLDKILIELKENSDNKTSIFFKPLFKFMNLYIFKGAIFEGKIGFMYSLYCSIKIFLKECTKFEKKHNNIAN